MYANNRGEDLWYLKDQKIRHHQTEVWENSFGIDRHNERIEKTKVFEKEFVEWFNKKHPKKLIVP